jgi:hypothetical protein
MLRTFAASMAAVALGMLAWWVWPEGPAALRDEGAIPSWKAAEVPRVPAAPRNTAASGMTLAPAAVSIAAGHPSAHVGTYPTRPFVARVGEEEGATDDAQSEPGRLSRQAAPPPPPHVAKFAPSESVVRPSDATERAAVPKRYEGEGAQDDAAADLP